MTHPFKIGLTLNRDRIDTLHVPHGSLLTVHITANAPRGAAS